MDEAVSRVQGLVARSTRALLALASLTLAISGAMGEQTKGTDDDDDGGDNDNDNDNNDAMAMLRAVIRNFIPDAVPLLLPLLRCRLVAPQAFACVQGLARAIELDLVNLADGYGYTAASVASASGIGAGASGTGASGGTGAGTGRGMGLIRDVADALRIVATVADRPLGR